VRLDQRSELRKLGDEAMCVEPRDRPQRPASRNDLEPQRRAGTALERAAAIRRARGFQRASPGVRLDGTTAHAPVHAEGAFMAPLERELLVDELEPRDARHAHEARARRIVRLDRLEAHLAHSDQAIEAVRLGEQWPNALRRRRDIHGACNHDRAHRLSDSSPARFAGCQPTVYHDLVPDDPTPAESNKALPLQLQLPAAQRPPERPERRRPGVAAGRWRSVGGAIGLAALAVVAGLCVFAFALPWYVRRQCIEEADAHGITLAIADVKIGAGGFRLLDVKATVAEIAGAGAAAPEVEVETAGLRPQKLSARGVELTLDGAWGAVTSAFAAWRASAHGGQGGAWAPSSLIVDGSRVVWRGPVGDNARVEAANVHLEATWKGGLQSVHGSSDSVKVDVPGGVLGPWRVDLDRAPGTSRVRVALDPGVPDACTVLVVGNDEAVTSFDAVVPRSPLARLGIPSPLVGLSGDGLQLDVAIHYALRSAARAEFAAKCGLHGVEAPGVPKRLDLAWEAAATGNPREGIDLKQARLSVGPLVGAVRGTLKTFLDGFRIDLAWKAGPVPCAAFDAPPAAGQPSDIATELRKLARSTGLARVSGDVSADGTLTFDSRDLGATAVGFAPVTTCKFALFASP
jgi:hypothetical protein